MQWKSGISTGSPRAGASVVNPPAQLAFGDGLDVHRVARQLHVVSLSLLERDFQNHLAQAFFLCKIRSRPLAQNAEKMSFGIL